MVTKMIAPRLILLLLVMTLAPGLVFAQSGSAGGSIGNDEKSLSGTRQERAVEPASVPSSRKSEAAPEERRNRNRSGGGNFDGSWAYVGVGSNCQGTGSGSFTVVGGRVAFAGGAGGGSVAPNGSFHTSAVGSDGVRVSATGRLSSNSGGGTYMRADGCGGRWSATRQ